MLITEYGPPDGGVYGASHAKQGYRNYPGMDSEDAKAQRCQDEMWQYADLIGVDGRVRELFQYTYDGNREDWGNFDIRTETFLRPFLARLESQGLPKPGVDPITPPVTPPVTSPAFNLEFGIRNLAYNNIGKADGIPYNPTLAFPKEATRLGLGAPQTTELRQLTGYVVQGFALAILYCRDGDWGNIKRLSW
jgi:hypothetical protein